jgi:hypothetical protein
MFRTLSFSVVSCICFGCGPGSPTASQLTYPISPAQLAAAYRHNPNDRTWHLCRVKCRLEPGTYTTHANHIEAHCVNNSGCVWFLTPNSPKDIAGELTITGVCRGITRDGRVREPGVDYYVAIDVEVITSVR